MKELQSGSVKIFRVLESSPSALPPVPTAKNHRSQEETINEVLDLTNKFTSVALFGPIGVGKSFVASAILGHERTKDKFGKRCYFMRCGLMNSLEGFLTRLCDAIHTDVEYLHSHIQSSPLILLLDDVDSILDPLTAGSRDIIARIEKFGSYEHVCLVTTSRMYPDIPGFRQVEVPTLSKNGAQNIFHGMCKLGKSPAVDRLIASLDFHPLSIEMLARCVHEKGWDESTLLEAWDGGEIGAMRTSCHKRLSDTIEPVFRLPTIEGLGAIVSDILKLIATSPRGVERCKLEDRIRGAGDAVDVLCRFTIVHHQDGFVKMGFPARFYFSGFKSGSAHDEDSPWDVVCMPGACRSSFHLSRGLTVTYFEGYSTSDRRIVNSDTIPDFTVPPWIPWVWQRLPLFVTRGEFLTLAYCVSRLTLSIFLQGFSTPP